MYGGVRGRKTKVGEKLLRFPPTRFKRETALSSRRSKDSLGHKGMHGEDARALHVRATPHYANQGMQVCKDFASAGGAF